MKLIEFRTLSNLEEIRFNEWVNSLNESDRKLVNQQFNDNASFDLENWIYNDLEYAIDQNGAESYDDLIDTLSVELVELINILGSKDEIENMIQYFIEEIDEF